MFGFSDLEDQLLSDRGAEVAAATLARLKALRERISQQTSAGLPPAEFQDAKLLLAALMACEQILLDTTHLKGTLQ